MSAEKLAQKELVSKKSVISNKEPGEISVKSTSDADLSGMFEMTDSIIFLIKPLWLYFYKN